MVSIGLVDKCTECGRKYRVTFKEKVRFQVNWLNRLMGIG